MVFPGRATWERGGHFFSSRVKSLFPFLTVTLRSGGLRRHRAGTLLGCGRVTVTSVVAGRHAVKRGVAARDEGGIDLGESVGAHAGFFRSRRRRT